MTEQLLHQFLIDMPAQWNDSIAIDSSLGAVTYGELKDTTQKLAMWLKQNGSSKQDRIVICLPKRVVTVEWILASLYLGATYVPVDYTAPIDRIKKIITNAQVSRVITLPDIKSSLIDAGLSEDSITAIDNIDTLNASEAFCLDVTPLEEQTVDLDDLAAFLYTSGSTGDPKGVMLSHRNISAFSAWAVDKYQISSEDRLSSHAPFHFDLSTMDLYATFMAGASVYILDEIQKRFPSTVTKVMQDKKITSWYSVPSALMLLEEKGALHRRDLSSLRQIFFAGEVYPLPELRKIMTRFPDVKFVNLYGPTETNVCTYYNLPEVPDESAKSIPIGRVCEHYELEILDDNDNALPVGEMGEVVITGSGVMKGYWQAPEKTAASRVAGKQDSYRTGDFGVLLNDGNVIYQGRKDSQVKIQGYRVELNEIENVANAHSMVKESVATVKEIDGVKQIYLAVAATDGSLDESSLLSWCSNDLPAYAVPKKAIIVDHFPRTSTGKIDRQGVNQLVASHEQTQSEKA